MVDASVAQNRKSRGNQFTGLDTSTSVLWYVGGVDAEIAPKIAAPHLAVDCESTSDATMGRVVNADI